MLCGLSMSLAQHRLRGVILGTLGLAAAGGVPQTAPVAAPAQTPLELVAPDGTELSVERFVPSSGRRPEALVVWIPSEFGFNRDHRGLAQRIADRGLEVWLVDLLQAYFIPAGHGALDAIPPQAVGVVLDEAVHTAPGRVYVLTSESGARLVLDAVWSWQAAHPGSRDLRGLILLHPFLYAGFPEPGEEVRFVPETALANLPVYLVQPALTTQAWRLPELVSALRRGGAAVYVERLEGVADGFVDKPPEAIGARDRAARAAFPALVRRAVRLLAHFEPAPLPSRKPAAASGGGGQAAGAGFRPYPDAPEAPALRLPDRSGRIHDLRAYRGRVVLLNFWASWCPPCVAELPSLNRFVRAYRDRGLVVLAVDVAEPRDQLEAFLQHTPVEALILLDAEGVTVRPWRVFGFPTNVLVDKAGRLRYLRYGGLDWDDPQVRRTVDALLAEGAPHASRSRPGARSRLAPPGCSGIRGQQRLTVPPGQAAPGERDECRYEAPVAAIDLAVIGDELAFLEARTEPEVERHEHAGE